MPRLTRWPAAACLLVTLTACTTATPAHRSTPQATVAPSTVAKATPPPTLSPPPSYRYNVFQLEALPAVHFGKLQGEWESAMYPANRTFTPRPDPLAGRTVEPETCRTVIRTGGLQAPYGDFVPSDTPAASAQVGLGNAVGDLSPYAIAWVFELTGRGADLFIDQYMKTPADCAHIRIDGVQDASVIDEPLPGFGERSRYLRRSFPVGNGRWTERILLFRTATYLMEIRLTGPSGTEASFLQFARQTRDLVQKNLKSS